MKKKAAGAPPVPSLLPSVEPRRARVAALFRRSTTPSLPPIPTPLPRPGARAQALLDLCAEVVPDAVGEISPGRRHGPRGAVSGVVRALELTGTDGRTHPAISPQGKDFLLS